MQALLMGGQACILYGAAEFSRDTDLLILASAEKTQRDKDWPMVRRLLEVHYFAHRTRPSEAQVRFWLTELRTPELLLEVVARHPATEREAVQERRLLALAIASDRDGVTEALLAEERDERARDRAYWQPLRADLERLRHERA